MTFKQLSPSPCGRLSSLDLFEQLERQGQVTESFHIDKN
jgi:hypothetical protein